jgi:hypothetical protein
MLWPVFEIVERGFGAGTSRLVFMGVVSGRKLAEGSAVGLMFPESSVRFLPINQNDAFSLL